MRGQLEASVQDPHRPLRGSSLREKKSKIATAFFDRFGQRLSKRH